MDLLHVTTRRLRSATRRKSWSPTSSGLPYQVGRGTRHHHHHHHPGAPPPHGRCTQCQAKFVSSQDLKKHVLEEHSATRYICVMCNTDCGTRDNLHQHFQLHETNHRTLRSEKTCSTPPDRDSHHNTTPTVVVTEDMNTDQQLDTSNSSNVNTQQ